jgi:regulator of protease activity HflC (stomatin/prohibitin superfamily)
MAIVGLSLLIAITAFALAIFRAGLHEVSEGHVAVYFRGGRLLETLAEPGYHFCLPFLTRVEQVQVTLQNDKVQNVLCGTTSGVSIVFESIEVSNRLSVHSVIDMVRNYTVNYDRVLIFDRVASEIAQLCSRHSLQEMRDKFQSVDDILMDSLQQNVERMAGRGLDILNVRVSTPVVPPEIAKLFLAQEEQRAQLKVAIELQRVSEKKAETARLERKMEAESRAEVLKIESDARIAERESQRLQSEIEDRRIANQIKSLADARFYEAERQASANKLLHTAEFVQLALGSAIANNTKIFFGEQVGSMFGSLLADLAESVKK